MFRFISTLPSRDFSTGMPPSLTEALPRLVHTDTSPAGAAAMGNNRMTVDDFLQAEFFRDVLIRTLRYLDSILEKDIEVCCICLYAICLCWYGSDSRGVDGVIALNARVATFVSMHRCHSPGSHRVPEAPAAGLDHV